MSVTNTYWDAPRRNAKPPLAPQPPRYIERAQLPRVTDGLLQATLDARVLNPSRRPNVSGRSDPNSLDISGMGGTPRRASKRHAFNKRRVYGAKSFFDSALSTPTPQEIHPS